MLRILMLALLLSRPASAGELAGVTLPDTATVGGQTLVLNGMGLREKYFVDVYVGGLYLPSRTTSGETAIAEPGPKRIVMHFIYKTVTRDQMAETFEEGIAKVEGGEALAPRMQKLEGLLTDVHKGDEVVLDYIPGTGTVLSINGTTKGTIEGEDFMRAIWSIYVGPNPANQKLKKGMLGGA
ncbi:MAG: hypothetical protein D6798_10625 [Deltaproteobacteria bacterium]|nr:MAG: hypothetical protein D6798_10625 [Deltaproteobacteria bacterium]